VALLNTIAKLLDGIMARRLAYSAEAGNILPSTHMGGRKSRSTEHALHHLVERIHAAWNMSEKEVVSLLLLDVTGAFNYVLHIRLIHNLRKRGVSVGILGLIKGFLTQRSTQNQNGHIYLGTYGNEHGNSPGFTIVADILPVL
jgi:hypothetical protein